MDEKAYLRKVISLKKKLINEYTAQLEFLNNTEKDIFKKVEKIRLKYLTIIYEREIIDLTKLVNKIEKNEENIKK